MILLFCGEQLPLLLTAHEFPEENSSWSLHSVLDGAYRFNVFRRFSTLNHVWNNVNAHFQRINTNFHSLSERFR
jgi:hypothetical protein